MNIAVKRSLVLLFFCCFSARPGMEARAAVKMKQPKKKELHGLVWGNPQHAVSSEHGVLDMTRLEIAGGHDYLAFSGADDKLLYLASNASGKWTIDSIAPGLNVGIREGARTKSLAVHAGVAYVPFIIPTDNGNLLGVIYDPSANLSGPWVRTPLYSTECAYLQDPSATIAGDSLVIAFDSCGPSKTSNDVFVARVPLSSLPASGVPLTAQPPSSVKITNVTTYDDLQSGPADDHPEIAIAGDELKLAWQRGTKTLAFAEGASTSTAWPARPDVLHTGTDAADQSLQLTAAGDTVLVARYVPDTALNNTPNCCHVFATTNSGGRWSTKNVGETNVPSQKPGVAIGSCGPSVAFIQTVQGATSRLVVATLAGGRWWHESVATDAKDPRLAPTPSGLEMVYVKGYSDIIEQQAKCYPYATEQR